MKKIEINENALDQLRDKYENQLKKAGYDDDDAFHASIHLHDIAEMVVDYLNTRFKQ